MHRAIGVYNMWSMPYKTVLNNVHITITCFSDRRSVIYKTPKGKIATETLYNEQMRSAGITISHISKYALNSADDLAALTWIFDNITIEDNLAGYEQFKADVGDMGVAVAYLNMAASGMHLIQRDLAPLDIFYFLLFDHPEEMKLLASAIQRYFDKILDFVCRSSAEVVLSGANYDASVTSPPFFAQHITCSLKQQAAKLHSTGKFILTHTDGENNGLLQEYLACGIDVADSICPAPMTSLSLAQVKQAFTDKITIWGGIPSISMLEDSMSDTQFYAYIDLLMASIGKCDHIIFSIADTTPPAAKFCRIEHLSRIIRSLGNVLGHFDSLLER